MLYVTLNLENSIFPLHETASQALRAIGRMTVPAGMRWREKWRVSLLFCIIKGREHGGADV